MQSAAEEIPIIAVCKETNVFEKLLQDFVKNGGSVTESGLGVKFSLGTNVALLQSIHCEIMGSEEGRKFLKKIQAKLAPPKLRAI